MSAELARVDDVSALESLDPSAREVAVTAYLTRARDQLAHAVEATGPAAVAAIKAEIATAAEATKQLGLSKDIQTDAIEMVRRAEYALGKAIRAGQERGEIRTRRDGGRPSHRDVLPDETREYKPSPYDFAKPDELHGNGDNNIYSLVDDVSQPEFEAALSDARDEGNLSRANVVRKVRGVKTDGLTPVEKLRKIRDLAPTGMTSDQIAREISASEDYVRRVAKNHQIDIPADRVMRGTRRLDHTRFVAKTVEQLEALASGLDVLDPVQVDWSEHEYWVTSLTDSLRALNRFASTVRKGPNG